MRRRLLLLNLAVILLLPSLAMAISGDVAGTWTSGSTVTVDGDIRVAAGTQLVIEPGVTVLFTGPWRFTVEGLLEAVGSHDQLIVFTRANPTEASKWRGLRFEGADDASILHYCVIEFAKAEETYPEVRGGGVYINNCSPTVSRCTIRYNYTHNANYNGAGGGICLNADSNSTIEYNYITENISDSGGGILVGSGSQAIIRYNIIDNNEAYYAGGGIYLSAWSNAKIHSNYIRRNIAYYWGGGGINLWNDNCTQGFCTQVYNNVIAFNVSTSASEATGGGGIYCRYNNSQTFNNTIAFNTARKGGGVYVLNQGSQIPTFSNSIIWGNSADTGSQVYLYPDTSSVAAFSYCDIQDGWTGTGNINADPAFVDAAIGDFHLSLTSPCIDAGDNTVEGLPTEDIEWDERRIDQPGTIDTGNGTAPIVDMGADEVDGLCKGDFDADGDRDGSDLWQLAQEYGQTGCITCMADINHDNDVDVDDLFLFALYYSRPNCP